MSTVQEILAAAKKLPEAKQLKIAKDLIHNSDDAWDKQIAKDCKAGHLDFLFKEAESAIRNGKTRDLARI